MGVIYGSGASNTEFIWERLRTIVINTNLAVLWHLSNLFYYDWSGAFSVEPTYPFGEEPIESEEDEGEDHPQACT